MNVRTCEIIWLSSIQEDRFPAISSRHHVVNSPGIFDPRFSWHGSTEAGNASNVSNVNRQGLTPSPHLITTADQLFSRMGLHHERKTLWENAPVAIRATDDCRLARASLALLD
ncbi:MAG: hypothetical protein NTV93_04225, partial [Verrucomicrobia bacterium]|nr:hypothetical protein [Verrucomicrobiota bacterium]